MHAVNKMRLVSLQFSALILCCLLSSRLLAEQSAGTVIRSKITNHVMGKTIHDTEELYITEDGTRFARYWNGGKNIEIAHLTKRSGVQYIYDADDGNGWLKLETPGQDLGIQSLLMFDQKMKLKNGAARYAGESKIAGLPCKKFTHKNGLSWCTWVRKNPKADKRFPTSITLASRWDFPEGGYSETVVQSVNFAMLIDERKLMPPSDVLKRPVFDPTKDKNNPTNVWCRSEAKKTGVDPCVDDDSDGQDDEEAWDVE